MKKNVVCLFVLLFSMCPSRSQGFANLDFESAHIVFNGYQLSVTDAFPDWTIVAPFVAYDDTSLSGGSISIFDSKPPYSLPPIQGTYFAWLVGSYNPSYGAISLGQTGQIPISAQSITFWGSDVGIQVTFNGQPLSFMDISNTLNYAIWGADISAYAGQTGQLLFTVPPYNNGGMIDNIQFSSLPIPEPDILGLLSLGGLAFLWHRRKAKAV